MSKSKHCWWNENNYTKKLIIESLNQTTYDFSNIFYAKKKKSRCTV